MESENGQNIPPNEIDFKELESSSQEEAADLQSAVDQAKAVVRAAISGLENIGIDKDLKHITTVEGSPTSPERALQLLNESIAREQKITLYTGLNICTGKCAICRYETLPVRPDQLEGKLDTSAENLITELDLLKKHLPALQNAEVRSLYIGGGTPSLMTQEQLSRLLEDLRKALPSLSPKEITIEGSPATWTPEKIASFRELGINRFSMGIQGLNDEWLSRVNRRHTSSDAFSAMESMNDAGVRYNVDMMCGFEGQTPESFGAEIQQLLKQQPPEITAYFYENRKQTDGRPLFIPPSDTQSSIEMWQVARELCSKAGYREGPMGWWLRQDMEEAQCWIDRWRDQLPLVGLGARGYSWAKEAEFTNLPLEVFANQTGMKSSYEEALSKGELPINPSATYEYDADKQTNRWMSFRLKADLATPILYKRELFGNLEQAGLGTIEDETFKISPAGLAVIEHIMTAINRS